MAMREREGGRGSESESERERERVREKEGEGGVAGERAGGCAELIEGGYVKMAEREHSAELRRMTREMREAWRQQQQVRPS